MCGRFALPEKGEQVAKRFGVEGAIDSSLRYNVTAGSQAVVIYKRASSKELTLMKWGFVPFWSRESRVKFANINARIETVAESGAYKQSFKSRRCIVPASGYFEWRKYSDGTKQPYYIYCENDDLIGLAAIYDIWKDAEGREFPSFAILTAPAVPSVSAIHDRMPVILQRQDEERWIEPDANESQLSSMITHPREDLAYYQISTLVNNPANDNAAILEKKKQNA